MKALAKKRTFSNTQLKNMIDKALVQFENWKLQVVSNPNPRIVHQLGNIMMVINTVTDITNDNLKYSYKMLSKRMAELTKKVSCLNICIINSLMEDDRIDENEENRINSKLKLVMESAVNLIQVVQSSFGDNRRNK